MLKVFLLIGCGLTVVAYSETAQAQAAPARQEYNFNHGWRMHTGDPAGAESPEFDDAEWQSVTLPRAWNEDDAFAVDIYRHSTGIAWYRKRFVLPEGAEDGKVFLEFEGVRVYVNGKEAGRHHNGVMAFGLDISDLVHSAPAENVFAVWTDNDWRYRDDTGQRFQWADRNFNANYGGLINATRPRRLRAGCCYVVLAEHVLQCTLLMRPARILGTRSGTECARLTKASPAEFAGGSNA